MTDEQLAILKHALGFDRGDTEYRNHFVTGPGSSDYPHCEALVSEGFMRRSGPSVLSGGDYVYSVTNKGRDALHTEHNGIADAAIHKAISTLAQGIFNTYGIRIDDINISWMRVSTFDQVRMVIESVDIRSHTGR